MTIPLGVAARLDLQRSWESSHAPSRSGRYRLMLSRPIMQSSKHIHLIGICGTAMASLAGMLQVQGHRVTGSDAAAYPPMSDLLPRWAFQFMSRTAERNLEPRPDLVVVGNAISRGNVELEHVLDTPHSVLFDGALICTTSFCPVASRWSLRARTARPPRPACWPGSMRWHRDETGRLRRRF